ncbi:hypothetical protein K458DRAFT_415153 [Lentithecium fluviatile CBS 122367]|uniref:Uncharacterized protein n=1 Tax=Lentithecium fluviatile CBS 122367 TaxID=1168545 RepID=A0A6G1JD35_9PLEO|nr:hypothetical protein K458DRAFT_415153 [Lentithecium fluviatile CBS 122367]
MSLTIVKTSSLKLGSKKPSAAHPHHSARFRTRTFSFYIPLCLFAPSAESNSCTLTRSPAGNSLGGTSSSVFIVYPSADISLTSARGANLRLFCLFLLRRNMARSATTTMPAILAATPMPALAPVLNPGSLESGDDVGGAVPVDGGARVASEVGEGEFIVVVEVLPAIKLKITVSVLSHATGTPSFHIVRVPSNARIVRSLVPPTVAVGAEATNTFDTVPVVGRKQPCAPPSLHSKPLSLPSTASTRTGTAYSGQHKLAVTVGASDGLPAAYVHAGVYPLGQYAGL